MEVVTLFFNFFFFFFAKCLFPGEDARRGHLCHIDTFLVCLFFFFSVLLLLINVATVR